MEVDVGAVVELWGAGVAPCAGGEGEEMEVEIGAVGVAGDGIGRGIPYELDVDGFAGDGLDGDAVGVAAHHLGGILYGEAEFVVSGQVDKEGSLVAVGGDF